MVVAFDYRYAAGTTDPDNPSYDAVIYSDDDGATWQIGGRPRPTDPGQRRRQRSRDRPALRRRDLHEQPAEVCRQHTRRPGVIRISYDGGITWTNVQYDYSLPVPSVEGSLIQLDPNTLLFAAPDDPTIPAFGSK